ncbi:MAG: cell division protein SepF [Eubacteriaceae bacterium]|jgi:cell division inhibitor SepF|nr:cell division protein SepF [Eubacteriaceae bacterium]
MNKITKFLGLSDEDENFEDDDMDLYDEDEMQMEEEPRGVFSSRAPKKQPQVKADGPEVLVLEPSSFDDAPGIVRKIRDNITVVVNLKNTDLAQARKIFDFLNGAVFALDGTINKIADNVFILAPRRVFVSTEMDTSTDFATPILEWDED